MTHYLVCATQRSGSTLLCKLLAQTEIAGTPKELLLLWLRERDRTGEAFWLEVLQKTVDLGSTPNGVFACKVMANYFPQAMELLRAVPRTAGLDAFEIAQLAFSRPKILHVRRRNILRQAISIYIADHCGIYHMADHEGGADPFLGRALENYDPDYNRDVPFDYARIQSQLRSIADGNRYWHETFASHDVEPLEIVYEDLVADRESTLAEALKFLGLEFDADSLKFEVRTSKLANEVNERFYEAYLAEATSRGDTLPADVS